MGIANDAFDDVRKCCAHFLALGEADLPWKVATAVRGTAAEYIGDRGRYFPHSEPVARPLCRLPIELAEPWGRILPARALLGRMAGATRLPRVEAGTTLRACKRPAGAALINGCGPVALESGYRRQYKRLTTLTNRERRSGRVGRRGTAGPAGQPGAGHKPALFIYAMV